MSTANRLAQWLSRPYQVFLVDPKGQRPDMLAFEHHDRQAVEDWLDKWAEQPAAAREGLHAAVRVRPAHRPPARPSTGDRLLSGAYGVEVTLLRFQDDDGDRLSIGYELRGEIPEDEAGEMFRGLLATLQQRREGGEQHA